jgi:hypothetical protein
VEIKFHKHSSLSHDPFSHYTAHLKEQQIATDDKCSATILWRRFGCIFWGRERERRFILNVRVVSSGNHG